MASFAEREGFRDPRTVIQVESLDDDTRVGLWNVFGPLIRAGYSDKPAVRTALTVLWTHGWNRSHDEHPGSYKVWGRIKERILGAEWWEALDVIENVVAHLYAVDHDDVHVWARIEPLHKQFNSAFEHYLVGWRFVDQVITRLDSALEVEAITEAQQAMGNGLPAARQHLDNAVALLGERSDPDYPNSVKEAISAVEAVVRKLTGAKDLAAGLKQFEATTGRKLHPALKDAWLKMYGWSSDEHGIRHGGIEAANVDQALAKYVLVSCSAFVSYLIEEGGRAELL